MAKRNVLSVGSGSLECDLACEIVGDTGGKDIYIGDSTYTMYVTIRNEGSTTYRLTGKQPDGTTNAHFELNFSAHILLAGTYENETYPQSDSPDWTVTHQTVSDTNYITNLFLFYTGQTPLTLPPNGTLVVPVQYRTDTESDAETCRITVKPGDDPALWSPLPGCAAGMQVTEDVTPYTFQLTAFVVGGDTLLNDGGTPNRFTLRLLNPTTTPILLQPNTTAFEISIDTNSDATGLCSAIQAKDISVTTTAQGFAAPTYPSGSNVPRSVWTVRTANQNTPIVIRAAGSVDFTFANVKTASAPGRSMIYVRCVNVPSMGGQVLITSVEKSPAFPAQGTGTNINAAQLLFAPSGLSSGGAALSLKGGSITSGGERFLLRLDGTNGYTGIRMDNIGGNGYGVFLESTTNAPVFVINQRGTGTVLSLLQTTNTNPIIDVSGGKGVVFRDMNGNFPGLTLRANTSVGAMQVNQSGAGNSAYFTGGAGVLIDNVGTNNNGLCINVSTNNNSALKVNQTGTNNSAYFTGGAGVKIDGVSSGNALYLSANTSSNAAYINQSGTGHALKIETSSTNQALYVTQSNASGMAAKFNGKVEIDGDLVVKGGNIILQSDANSSAYQIILMTGQAVSGHGATLLVKNSGNDQANIQIYRAYVSNHVYWGANQEAKVYYDNSGGVKGLYMDQPAGDQRGHIQGDGR